MPLFDYVKDTGYFKINAKPWFATRDDCELNYEFSFTTMIGIPISNTYTHIFSQSFYTPEKLWVKTGDWNYGIDENRYYAQVRVC